MCYITHNRTPIKRFFLSFAWDALRYESLDFQTVKDSKV